MSTDKMLKAYSEPRLSRSVASSGKITAEPGSRAGGFNYTDLLNNLREKEEEEARLAK